MNPFHRLRQFLASAGLPADAAFFVPSFGIGDRLRFLAYLHLFELFNAARAYLVFESGAPLDLLSFLPALRERVVTVPSELIVKPLVPNLYAMGDERPGARRVYFTWHTQYLGGQNAAWEQVGHESVTHDLMVKQILGVPAVFAPQKLHLEAVPAEREPIVYIAPYSASNPGVPQALWLQLAQALEARGLRVVCNARFVTRNVYETQDFDELHRRYPTVDCSVTELAARVARARGVVTVRSGLSDLFSLTDLPAVTLTNDRIGAFWKLPAFFGHHTEINVDRQAPEQTLAQIVQRLAA